MTTALELYVKATTRLQYLARSQRGQGTVEYVGILFIVAAICAAILTLFSGGQGASLGQKVIDAVGSAIDKVVKAAG